MTRFFCLKLLLLLSIAHSVSSFAFWQQTTTSNIPKDCKLLILPGFGNDSGDYTMEGSLVSSLITRGWSEDQINVLQVERSDWLTVFLRGIFDLKFWQANASPNRPAFRWYLEKVADAIGELDENESVILVGHSAGGWLARAAVGYGSNDDDDLSIDLSRVKGIVTLGAPNLPPPANVMDMTRGALRITNEEFPGAFHAPDIFYVTVIGDAVRGKKQERKSPFERTTVDGFAFNSYEAVCGDGTTVGDGVVPVCSAHVDGSTQLNLDGVFHSINRPDMWYGTETVIDAWHDTMLSEMKPKEASFDPMKIFSQ